jgi:hypothetical protein
MLTVKIVSPLCGHEPPHEWDPNKPGDLEKIRKFFKEKLKAGFHAFVFPEKGGPGKLIREFDEEAERIILIADNVKVVQPPTRG